jgi:hypothetical protein
MSLNISHQEYKQFFAICRHMGARNTRMMPNGIKDNKIILGRNGYHKTAREVVAFASAFDHEHIFSLQVKTDNKMDTYECSVVLSKVPVILRHFPGMLGRDPLYRWEKSGQAVCIDDFKQKFIVQHDLIQGTHDHIFNGTPMEAFTILGGRSRRFLEMMRLFIGLTTDIKVAEEHHIFG